jgi:CCR4-NOT transcription complex subunit 4
LNSLVNGMAIERPPSVPTFPDFAFGEGGTFSFSLDPDVKGKRRASEVAVNGDGKQHTTEVLDTLEQLAAPTYFGSFDPFSDSALDATSDHHLSSGANTPPLSSEDLSRRGSRFGFARRSSHGVKGGELASALVRSAFASGGRDSPSSSGSSAAMFAPPGFPASHRPPSSIGYKSLPPPTDEHSWPSSASGSALPPSLVRSLASPGTSTLSSPQLSPGPVAATSPLPPGIALSSRTPIAAASFPLPPPAPKPSGQQQGTAVAKEEIFALIAAAQAQASAPKQQQHAQGSSAIHLI